MFSVGHILRHLVALGLFMVFIITSSRAQQVDFPCLNIPDSLWVSDPAMVKERMVSYLEQLKRVKEPLLSTYVKRLLNKAYSDVNFRLYFSDELESLLFHSNSPYRNDSLYIVFLRETLVSKLVPEEEKSRYRFQLENVQKNMPGSKAVDFEYLDKSGHRFKMSDIKSDYLVLFFYNPDCMRCKEAERWLMSDSVLVSPCVKVLAVYPGIQTNEWLNSPSALPESWIDGCSPDGAVNNRLLYFIQSTPAIYLLDKDKNVILKDVSPKKLHAYLETL